MTVIRGERFGAVGPKQSYTFPRMTPVETAGLTTVLPTAEPATSQFIVTVAAGDMVGVPAGLVCGYWIADLIVAVKNVEATGRTVSFRMIKNGTSVLLTSLSTMTATTGGGKIQSFFSGVAAGDVLELRLWAPSSTNIQLVYTGYHLVESRVGLAPGGRWQPIQDATWTTSATGYPVLASWPGGGTGSVGSSLIVPAGDTTAATGMTMGANATFTQGYFGVGPTYGLVRAQAGDSSSANFASTQVLAFTSLGYAQWAVLSSLKFRRMLGSSS